VFYGDSRFKKLFDVCDQNRIEWHGWSAFEAYPYKLSLLNCDIGLCPLIDNEFNRMKSAIKWMEYSMVGMATVAANIPPYSKVISNGNTGLLCNEDEKEWENAIEYLIKSKSARFAMACEAKQEVLKNHNIHTKAHLWADAYNSVLNPKVAMV
jgi:glycosyltransferase involved in cell wall biosynthesis